VTVVEDDEQLEDNLLKPHLANRITNGGYPFLWLNVTYRDVA
jgi:hypothetical protein